MSAAASEDAPSDAVANFFFIKTSENTLDSIEKKCSMYYCASELDSYPTPSTEQARRASRGCLACIHSIFIILSSTLLVVVKTLLHGIYVPPKDHFFQNSSVDHIWLGILSSMIEVCGFTFSLVCLLHTPTVPHIAWTLCFQCNYCSMHRTLSLNLFC